MADSVASALAIIDATQKIIRYAIDFWNAPKEQQQVKDELENLNIILQRLEKMCKDARPGAPWLNSLLRESGKKGTLVGLKQVLGELADSMHPDNKLMGTRVVQRSIWHWKKEEVTHLQNQINKLLQFIQVEFELKHDATLTKAVHSIYTLQQAIETGFQGVNERLDRIEFNQTEEHEWKRREQEERAKEKADLERQEIVAWLSPLSFIAKREQLLSECLKETGDWLWQDQRFKCWTEGRKWHLYCIGPMGVGKTVLSAILTHRLPPSPHPPLILNLYLNYKASKAQTTENLICSMLKQVFQLDEDRPIPEELSKLYRRAKHFQTSADIYQDLISAILTKELGKYNEFYIIIDGTDELPSMERSKLFKKLHKLPHEKSRIVIMTRPIQGETRKYDCPVCDNCKETTVKIWYRCKICNGGNYDLCLACKQRGFWCLDRSHVPREPYPDVPIRIEIPDQDIERYVRWSIKSDASEDDDWSVVDERVAGRDGLTTTAFEDLYEQNPDLLEEIVSVIIKKANGRFLFARLYLDSLKVSSSRNEIRRTLRKFPDEIDDIYKDAMDRIKKQEPKSRDKAFKILGLVAHARRALSMSELQHGLAAMELNEDDEETEESLSDATNQTKTILDCTSALIVTEKRDKNSANLEASNLEVQLVHRTLENYLHRDENEQQWFKGVETDIAKACLAYLRIVLPSKPPRVDDYYESRSAKFPFLAYASQFWGDHVRYAVLQFGSAATVQEPTLGLLNDSVRLQGSIQAAWATTWGGSESLDTPKNLDRLHVCAWNGLSFAVSALDPDRDYVDVTEPKYLQTPLMYACRRNHVEVVAQLLNLGASCRVKSARGRTALFEAIEGQHTEIVDLLSEKIPPDLDINAVHPEQSHRTALMLAAREGLIDIVRTLLTYPGIDIDAQDTNGWTALYIAVKFGYKNLVAILLEAKSNIELKDTQDGRFALRCAAERAERKDSEEMAILEILLEHGADLDTRDKRGGNAILRAVNWGNLNAMQVMMNHQDGSHSQALMKCEDEDGQTLLHGACRYGFTEIALELISRGHDLNPQDKAGRTPLHLASQHEQTDTLNALLDKSADPRLFDNYGRTPKKIAWQYGCKAIIEALEKDTISPSEPQVLPEDSQLPLWATIRQDLFNALLQGIEDRPEELTFTEPFTQNTLLHCAVEINDPTLLDQLLSLPKALRLLNAQNHVGRTPLHLAAIKGTLPVIELLLAHGAALDIKDSWNDDPIFMAQSNYKYDAMFALLEAGAHWDKGKIDTKILFFKAVDTKRSRTVQILLERWGVDRSMQNREGVRAINIAKANDDTRMELVLRSAPTVNFGELPHLETNDSKEVVRDERSQGLSGLPSLDGVMVDTVAPFPMRPGKPQPQIRNAQIEGPPS